MDRTMLAYSSVPNITVGHSSKNERVTTRRTQDTLPEFPNLARMRSSPAALQASSSPNLFEHMPSLPHHHEDMSPSMAHRKRAIDTMEPAEKHDAAFAKYFHASDAAAASTPLADEKSPLRLEPLAPARRRSISPIRAGSVPVGLGGERHTLLPLSAAGSASGSPKLTARSSVSASVSPDRPRMGVKVLTKKDRLLELCKDEHEVKGKSRFHAKYDPTDVLLFKAIFDEMDDDGDGSVTLGEFRVAMEKRGSVLREMLPHEAAPVRQLQYDGLFRHIDTNADGLLTFPELLNLVYPYANPRDMQQMLSLAEPADQKPRQAANANDLSDEQIDEIRSLFALYDADGDGELTLEEFRAATMGMSQISREDVKKMMQTMDDNGDMVLTCDEFLKGMSRLYTHPETFD
eukprot:TRINITY_DN1334_c1_g1_i1.p1 TRINITY_DN1334_c1_g1~~TRINITY_DN1334_c1_g1_i1.p1  ORF type:complete len:404 (-),score=116.28 TRINITY_DN1334_c1_g1_i1:203-1414(-)